MSKQKILVTTTPSVEGWEIQSYLGPVFTHIVAGTGFFSDFAAGLTDIFGGRSQSYQKQLSAINSEAIEQLKEKASQLGGNLILGLRIDHDEISGKSKQMFMITAYGTAVHGQPKVSFTEPSISTKSISSDDVEIELKKKILIGLVSTIPFKLSAEQWSFAIENQISEIAQKVILNLEYLANAKSTVFDATYDLSFDSERKYFYSISRENATSILYASLNKSSKVFSFIRDIIHNCDLLDINKLISLLESDDFLLKKRSIALANTDKPFYTPEDIELLKILISKIETSFPIRAMFSEEKSKFTSSVKKIWLCECGSKNQEDFRHCEKCAKDIYGLYNSDVKPEKVLSNLNAKLEILQNSFEQKN